MKAARALAELARQRGMETSGARICLTKRIPSRAGLGGGSADCAETLKALNRLWNLNFPMETLLELGAKLGADVPFCLTGGLARVSGVGERIEPLRNPPHCALVLITPGGGLSTPEVFRAYDEMVKQGEDFGGKHAENAVKYSPENPDKRKLHGGTFAGSAGARELRGDRAFAIAFGGSAVGWGLCAGGAFIIQRAGSAGDSITSGDWKMDKSFPQTRRALRPHDRQRFDGFRRF